MCSRPFRPALDGFAHLCRSRPRGSVPSSLPSDFTFYVADPVSSIVQITLCANENLRVTALTLVRELIADTFVRKFYGIEYEFASQEVGAAEAHRFSQHSIYFSEGQLFRL
jgi:hypothetical protein